VPSALVQKRICGSMAAPSYSTASGRRRGRMTRKWLLPLSQLCRCHYDLPRYT